LGSSVSSIIMSVLFENQLLNYYSVYILSAVILLFTISLIYFRFAEKNLENNFIFTPMKIKNEKVRKHFRNLLIQKICSTRVCRLYHIWFS
jgi:hypothetical protein